MGKSFYDDIYDFRDDNEYFEPAEAQMAVR